jgi:hypothetical protein
MPQIKLITTSSKSADENRDFAVGAGTASIIPFHFKGQLSKRQDCKPLRINYIKAFALAIYGSNNKELAMCGERSMILFQASDFLQTFSVFIPQTVELSNEALFLT